ncbi:hypothetical protein ASE23_12955 [Rhizobium sp. Root73]|uniref:VPA1269 family protein n=1 Tax=unclassified Rhizobium TaxID=2613769 RepID=UPI0007293C0F|nr:MULTISPECIES: VPA1269 family protein [unclassified Rhizobium]KQY03700.1 hypothetical protein ASD36_15155 [Rhizobium sp. Root1334]KRC00340.1 hypothetical protein ASE23_12955 [Rhizobium sp. Root73]
MIIEFVDDENTVSSAEDGGCITNVSSQIVLRRLPSCSELVELFADFEAVFRQALYDLWAMPCGEIEAKYGAMNFNQGVEGRDAIPYAFIAHPMKSQFYLIESGAVRRALAGNRDGKPVRRLSAKGLTPKEMIAQMSRDDQLRIVKRLSDGNLDETISLGQTCVVGWASLAARVNQAQDTKKFFDELASMVDDFFRVQVVNMKGGSRKGDGRRYAPAWFGQYLVTKGIWLFPQSFLSDIRNLYPNKYRPLLSWLSLGPELRDVAEHGLRLEEDKSKSTLKTSLNVFVIAALSSSMWEYRRFCPAALVVLKSSAVRQNEVRYHEVTSSATNHAYKRLAAHLNVDLKTRPEAPLFLQKKRLTSPGVRPFDWCRAPSKKNTQLAARIAGKEVTSVPSFLKYWADDMTSTLTHYGVQTVSTIIDCQNAWLIYLYCLGEDLAPKSLMEVDRLKHVNSGFEGDSTFVNFLRENDLNPQVQIRAISVMQRAWTFFRAANGMVGNAHNPFDAKLDPPVREKSRKAKSARKAIQHDIYQIIYDEHVRDDFAFARSLPEQYRRLKTPGEDHWSDHFWPAVPLILMAIMRYGLRLKSARYLDSGEGDEYRYDPHTESMVENSLVTVKVGRQVGFLQGLEIIESGSPRTIPRVFVASGKTGAYGFDYCDLDIAEAFVNFVKLQETYNPISRPIKAIDSRDSSDFANLGNTADVFPAFREPDGGFVTAISGEKVRWYYIKLLEHCEPILKEKLGYPVTLVRDGRALIQLHAFRVSANTHLRQAGGTPEDAQALLGHKNPYMAEYYFNPSDEDSYRALRTAMKSKEAMLAKASEGDKTALHELAKEIEDLEGGPTVAARALRNAAELELPPPFVLFDHGICTGTCETGGPTVNRRPTPVWRRHACSSCVHRATGPKNLQGLCTRTNMLAWEIRQSIRRSADLNSSLEKVEEDGGSGATIRSAIQREFQHRANLEKEHQAEFLNIKKYEAAAAKIGPNAIFGPQSGRFDLEFKMREVHEFELLHTLIKDLELRPALRVDFDPSVELEWQRVIHAIVRSNSLADVVYRPNVPERRAMIAVGDTILDKFPEPSMLQLLIDSSFSSESFPPLAAWKEAIEEGVLSLDRITAK